MEATLKKSLKARAHHVKALIQLGSKGLTPAVIAETDVALTAHELIKVKLTGVERIDRVAIANTLSSALQAELIQIIGSTVILYRKKPLQLS